MEELASAIKRSNPISPINPKANGNIFNFEKRNLWWIEWFIHSNTMIVKCDNIAYILLRLLIKWVFISINIYCT